MLYSIFFYNIKTMKVKPSVMKRDNDFCASEAIIYILRLKYVI